MNQYSKKRKYMLAAVTIVLMVGLSGCSAFGKLYTKNLDERVLRVISEKYPDNEFEITAVTKGADYYLTDQSGVEFRVMVVDSEESQFKCQDNYLSEYLKANQVEEQLEELGVSDRMIELGNLDDEAEYEETSNYLMQIAEVMKVPFTVKDYGEVSTGTGDTYFFSENDGEMTLLQYDCSFANGDSLLNEAMQYIRIDQWQQMDSGEACAEFLNEIIGDERETEMIAEALCSDESEVAQYKDDIVHIFVLYQMEDDGDIQSVTRQDITIDGEEEQQLSITSSSEKEYECNLKMDEAGNYEISGLTEQS